MGLIRDVLGIGKAVKEVAEVFVVNKSENAEFEHLEHAAALNQFSAEFKQGRGNWFNNIVNGLNRLPRPILAIGTVGLFVFSMIDPIAFSARMSGLDTIPRELWWLLGAIVSFYFGAREMHYIRKTKPRVNVVKPVSVVSGLDRQPESNAAVSDWQKSQPKG